MFNFAISLEGIFVETLLLQEQELLAKPQMQGRGRGRGSFFDFDPFAGFGGMGGHQSLFSSVFGGRDPFDDPFFARHARPLGSPFGNMFESSFFGPMGNPFSGAFPSGFIEHQVPQDNERRGPVIEELDSDDENAANEGDTKAKENPRKHGRLDKEPYVEVPDDEADEERNKRIRYRNESRSRIPPQSQPQCFTFQSSSVSYGGANGAYYTKSMTRRAGSDGVAFEELKEADSTTGQANHRISRGLHSKGHTLSKKLNSDGRVDTMQTLHNLREDELTGFEQAWEGSAGRHLPGWRQSLEGGNNTGNSELGQMNRGGWALPSTQRLENPSSSHPRTVSGNDAAAHLQRTGRTAPDRGSHGSRGRTRP